MNDQTALQLVQDTELVGQSSIGQDKVHDMTNRRFKRFQRNVSRLADQEQVAETVEPDDIPVVIADAPVTRLAATPVPFPAPVLAPFLTPTPISIPKQGGWETLELDPSIIRQNFLSGAPLVNFFRKDPAAKAFDLLRTRLLQALKDNGWHRIAIAAPTHGCGSTFTAVNLAQSLARVPGSRNVLMDLNHRTPGVAAALDIEQPGDMRGFLRGEVAMDHHLVRVSKTLALGLTGDSDADAAELLLDARTGETLSKMSKALRPDVVMYDLPPILAYDDLAAFLPQVDGVLLVADGTQTEASHLTACEEILEGQTPILGVILNRARESGLKNYDV